MAVLRPARPLKGGPRAPLPMPPYGRRRAGEQGRAGEGRPAVGRPGRRPSRAARSAALRSGGSVVSTCPLERRPVSERAGARWARPCGARQSRGAWEAPYGAGAWSSLPRWQGAQGKGRGRADTWNIRVRPGQTNYFILDWTTNRSKGSLA